MTTDAQTDPKTRKTEQLPWPGLTALFFAGLLTIINETMPAGLLPWPPWSHSSTWPSRPAASSEACCSCLRNDLDPLGRLRHHDPNCGHRHSGATARVPPVDGHRAMTVTASRQEPATRLTKSRRRRRAALSVTPGCRPSF